MVNFLVKHKIEVTLFSLLAILYFVLRLPHLTLQPIFADEAIYIRWAQVMKSEPTLRFLPLSDGKTPLFMWAMIPFFKVFPDPLYAGRFLSVVSGFFTLMGVYLLSKKVFSSKLALWAGLFYVTIPYTVFFDRMALVDSMLAGFTVWIVYFAIWLAQKTRLDLAMILGFILGGAWLTKTPGFLNLFLLPLSILAFKRSKNDQHYQVKLFIFWIVAIGIALFMYNALRLGPNFHQLSSRNADYLFSVKELIPRPLDPFIPHFRDMADWFPKLLTWPVLIAGLIGIIFVIKERNKKGLIILFWALIPLLLDMTFLKTFTARYLLSPIPLFLILAGYGVEKASKKIPSIILLVLVLIFPLIFDYQLLTSPPPTSLPKEERIGYFEDWTAGYGFKEIGNFLLQESKKEKIVVGTEGFFGTLPDGIQIYLDKANVAIVGSTATISAQIKTAAKTNKTYFVGNKKNLEGKVKDILVIKEFPKAKSTNGSFDSTVLYQVLP